MEDHPAPARDYTIQGIEDPATQTNNIDNVYAGVEMWAKNMGVHMLGPEMLYMSAAMLQRGTTLQDPANQRFLLTWMQQHPERIWPGGRIDSTIDFIAGKANQDFFVRLDHGTYTNWAMELSMGVIDEEIVRQRLADQAYAFYPHLRERLNKGETVAQIINPYRQIAADELEVDIGQISPLDTKWSFMTGMADPENAGSYRLPTYSEVQEAARRDTRWWDTSKGRQTDAGMTRTLLEAFGKVSY